MTQINTFMEFNTVNETLSLMRPYSWQWELHKKNCSYIQLSRSQPELFLYTDPGSPSIRWALNKSNRVVVMMQVYKQGRVLGQRILRLKNAFEKLIKELKFINLLSPLITEIQTGTTVPKSIFASFDNLQSRDFNHSLPWTVSPINIIELKFQDTVLN